MSVLFVYPSCDNSYPLQIGSLSAFLKQNKIKTHLLFLLVNEKLNKNHFKEIKNKIIEVEPKFVCFSCYETSFRWIRGISDFIKIEFPNIKVIVGGYYPTLAPEDVISYPAIDIICRGEGEYPLLELIKNPQKKSIDNLWIKINGRIIKNKIRPLIENLDKLPFPDREMLDYQSQINLEPNGQRSVKVMASRGCPFECTYCSNKYFRELAPNKNKYLRMRSPGNVISEIKILKNRYDFDLVGFHDDNLTLDVGWLKEFAEKYKKEIKKPFYCAARVESCSVKVMDFLKSAGCSLLLIGVESGDGEFRKKVLKRTMSNEQIINVFKLARERSIKTWSFTMVGLPFETKAMIVKTLLLNWRSQPDFVMASIFYPFTGTELGNICYEKNWVDFDKKESVNSYAWETILNHPFLSSFEIKTAKYLNSLMAVRSKFFWQTLLTRVGDKIKFGRRM